MALVKEYQIQPIIVPAELKLKREFYKNHSHLSGVGELGTEDYDQYDCDTLFYDIFIDKEGTLRAIGPPLLNLAKQLLPIKVYQVSGKHLTNLCASVTIKLKDRTSFYTFKTPHKLDPTNHYIFKFNFASRFEQMIELQPFYHNYVGLQFTTLQKNNHHQWISDWIVYHHDAGVNRFLIYDNGSDDFRGLHKFLHKIAKDVEIILIYWPFKYGPVRSHQNKFCHAGQNNHAHQVFTKAQWTGHFDIDEYVVTRHTNLLETLNTFPGYIGLLGLNNYVVPCTNTINSHSNVTARDFSHREIQPKNSGHKYFMKSNAYRESRTHGGKLKFGYFKKQIPLDTMCFFHYVALTTNWKPYVDRLKVTPFRPDLHTEDLRVIQKLKKLLNTL